MNTVVENLDTQIRAYLREFVDDHDGGGAVGADALRAVLDLHRADEYGACIACGVDTHENPIPWTDCDTVQTVARQLGVQS